MGVNAISHPWGRGNSSATSKDCCRRWAWWVGLGAALAPVPSCSEAGEDCDRACRAGSLGGWLPESVLDCRECDPESGSLKNDSGRSFFLQELGFGFITELNNASRSVSRSCATWITCCPGRGCSGLLLIFLLGKSWGNVAEKIRRPREELTFDQKISLPKVPKSPELLSLYFRIIGVLFCSSIIGNRGTLNVFPSWEKLFESSNFTINWFVL